MFGTNNHSKRRFKPLKVLFFVLVFAAFILAIGWVVMFLWNAILPDTIGVKPLNYWKALGLLVLARILFGNFGKRGGPPWGSSKKGHWRNKWRNMSHEERSEAKSRWKEYCRTRKQHSEKEEDE